MLPFDTMAQQCAPEIHTNTLAHIVQVESGYNPFAIGVVGTRLPRQPRDLREAIATAAWLEGHHYNFSVGLGQINRSNFARYGLTLEAAFDPCRNLQASAAILKDCYVRALQSRHDAQTALRDSFSCYYSGSFTAGYQAGYVAKVVSGRAGQPHEPAAHSRLPKDEVASSDHTGTAASGAGTAAGDPGAVPTVSALLF
jgi:type IV secretion system protein VirB1